MACTRARGNVSGASAILAAFRRATLVFRAVLRRSARPTRAAFTPNTRAFLPNAITQKIFRASCFRAYAAPTAIFGTRLNCGAFSRNRRFSLGFINAAFSILFTRIVSSIRGGQAAGRAGNRRSTSICLFCFTVRRRATKAQNTVA